MNRIVSAMCLGLLILPVAALAVPEIDGVAGDFNQNATATISGTGFGVKNPAPPLKYDDFQNGTPGQMLEEGSPPWGLGSSHDNQSEWVKYTTDNPRFPGDISVLQDFGPTNQGYKYNNTISVDNLNLRSGDGVYIHGWNWSRTYNGMPRNAKVVFYSAAGEWAEPSSRWDFYGLDSGHQYVARCNGDDTTHDEWGLGGADFNLGDQSWGRFEAWHYRGTSNGQDGQQRLWMDGRELGDGLYGNFLSGSNCPVSSVYIMSYYDQDGSNGAGVDFIWSEIYVDITQARVEIGDDPVFANCTHREIQIPQTWSSGAISFTVNQGAFPNGSTGYVFVVDENGDVSPTGESITFGGSVDLGAPGKPGKPVF